MVAMQPPHAVPFSGSYAIRIACVPVSARTGLVRGAVPSTQHCSGPLLQHLGPAAKRYDYPLRCGRAPSQDRQAQGCHDPVPAPGPGRYPLHPPPNGVGTLFVLSSAAACSQKVQEE